MHFRTSAHICAHSRTFALIFRTFAHIPHNLADKRIKTANAPNPQWLAIHEWLEF